MTDRDTKLSPRMSTDLSVLILRLDAIFLSSPANPPMHFRDLHLLQQSRAFYNVYSRHKLAKFPKHRLFLGLALKRVSLHECNFFGRFIYIYIHISEKNDLATPWEYTSHFDRPLLIPEIDPSRDVQTLCSGLGQSLESFKDTQTCNKINCNSAAKHSPAC